MYLKRMRIVDFIDLNGIIRVLEVIRHYLKKLHCINYKIKRKRLKTHKIKYEKVFQKFKMLNIIQLGLTKHDNNDDNDGGRSSMTNYEHNKTMKKKIIRHINN